MQKSSILTPTWSQHGSQKGSKMRPKRPLEHAPEALDDRSLHFATSLKTIVGSFKNGPAASPTTTHINGSKTVQEGFKNNIECMSKLEVVWRPIWIPFGCQLGPNMDPSCGPTWPQIGHDSMLEDGSIFGSEKTHLAQKKHAGNAGVGR